MMIYYGPNMLQNSSNIAAVGFITKHE